ncbi:uncharacterized protein [Prorops nasuta]|uniref:uncharacterized protein n=1 Tax=Prorops nasuta TaxID=863751 RepID=UPI0034D00A92
MASMNQREKDIFIKGKIIALKEEIYTISEIARKLNLNRHTVSKWIDRYEQNGLGGLQDRRKSNHGLAKTTAEENRIIVNTMENNPFQPSAMILNEISSQVTPKTIRNILHRQGIHCHRPCKKIKYTNEHKEERIGFVLQHLSKTEEYWDKVIWTDEKVLVSTADGRMHVWRPDDGRLQEKYELPRDKSSRISLAFWGVTLLAIPRDSIEGEGGVIPHRSQGVLTLVRECGEWGVNIITR